MVCEAVAKYLGMATVDFVDGNSTWRDRGRLTLREDGLYVLDLVNDEGSRVFPLTGRRAEVYLDNNDSNNPWIVEGRSR